MNDYIVVENPVRGTFLVVKTTVSPYVVIAECDGNTEANQVAVALNA